jgi:hypothetical protein
VSHPCFPMVIIFFCAETPNSDIEETFTKVPFSSYSPGMLPFFPCVFYPSGGPVPCRPNHRRVPRPGAELAGGAAEGHGVGGDQCPAAGGGLETWKNVTWPAGSWSK